MFYILKHTADDGHPPDRTPNYPFLRDPDGKSATPIKPSALLRAILVFLCYLLFQFPFPHAEQGKTPGLSLLMVLFHS